MIKEAEHQHAEEVFEDINGVEDQAEWESTRGIIVIVGASGSGKTTLAALLKEEGLPQLVTSTTRPMRPGEVDGEDYHFLDVDYVDEIEFLESTVYNGNTYGLTMHEVKQALLKGKTFTVVMDRNGARAMKQFYPHHTRIVHLKVSRTEMEQRMKDRGDEEDGIQARLRHAEETGEFESFEEADLTLEGLSPPETVEWVLAMSQGGIENE